MHERQWAGIEKSGLPVKIFISYSSRHRDLCERLRLALEADGRHEVFVDRSELRPGQPFDETLRDAIEATDLVLYLVSPESIAPGSYALAELSIAQKRWRHPGGHVLPVMVAPTATESIPPYLRAVTILQPQGDTVAETVAAVEEIRRRPRRVWRWLATLAAGIAVLGAVGVTGYLQWQKQRAEDAQVATLTTTARQLCDSGNQALAWQRYDEAIARYPDRPLLRLGREDCGMGWLREIRVRDNQDGFTSVVDRVQPILTEAAASASGRRAADLRAHIGWGDFLRIREGAGGLDPATSYAKALAEEASNVYAHAMWGHYIMVKRGPIADAKQHFAAALASGRERAYVRNLQLAAMLYYHEPAGQIEAARIANDIRKSGETLEPAMRARLWTYVYTDGLVSRDRRDAFVSALRDTDSAATFRWLYPENEVASEHRIPWRFMLASLEEASGERAVSRARFESLRDDLQREHASGPMLDEALKAITRLTHR